MKRLLYLFAFMMIVSISNAQNFYVYGTSGIMPADTLTKANFANGIEFGYIHNNFSCGLAIRSNYEFKDYFITAFPTATIFETNWSSLFVYCGLGANVKNFKQLFVEYGGGLNIPINKDWIYSPSIAFDYFNQTSPSFLMNMTIIYIIPSKKKDAK